MGEDPAGGDGARDADAGDADGAACLEFVILGGPDEGPTLDLDHERFAYAGKFVTPRTGKAVTRVAGTEAGAADAAGDGADSRTVVAAAAFDRDRTDSAVVRIRYVTVRRDRRGRGVGPRLLAFLAERVLAAEGPVPDAAEVRIAVNNPFAYQAAYRAGFGYTGEETGLAELLLARPGDRSTAAYRRGLSAFREREDLDESERAFLSERDGSEPPPVVEP